MKKRRSIVTFFRTLLVSLVLFALLGFGVYAGYNHFVKRDAQPGDGNAIAAGLKKGNVFMDLFDPMPQRINFVVLGTDKDGTRTDSIIVGSFLPAGSVVSLVSVPRDTLVTMPPERLSVVKTYNSYAPNDGVMRINEVHHHAGEENGIEYAVLQLEEMLQIDLEYYVEINLEGFRYLVDAIGGVNFDVPQRMYYHDPTQKLLIDLQPGMQLLDGHNAEGLVRYRHSYNDFGRMDTQQKFIKAMMTQMLSSENIATTIPSIAATGLKYVKTNFNLAELPKYLKTISEFSTDNIISYTVPTTPQKVNGKDYQLLDEEATRDIIKQAFFNPVDIDALKKSSIGKSIQILNGAQTPGLAAKAQEKLEQNGFVINNIGDYEEQGQAATRLYVKKEGQGADLSPHFINSTIIVDAEYTADYDIVIVLGTSEDE